MVREWRGKIISLISNAYPYDVKECDVDRGFETSQYLTKIFFVGFVESQCG